MSSYYNILAEQSPLRFDLKQKKIYKRRKELIPTSPYINKEDLSFLGIEDLYDNPYEVIEKLYGIFYRSVPGEREAKSNFRALGVDQLSFKEMRENMDRTAAQNMLEGYILCMSLAGKIKWENPEHYYWQSDKHKKLVLFKEWVINE